jgi:bla regulator protein BlaR1
MNSPFFEWLLRASWQAAVLTVLVLCVQFCLRKRLDGRWRHLLWFLVLARLVMPWSPPSPVSLFNYVHFERLPAVAAQPQVTPAPVQTAGPARVTDPEVSAPALPTPDVHPSPQGRPSSSCWSTALSRRRRPVWWESSKTSTRFSGA